MIPPQALVAAIALALAIYGGHEVVVGAKHVAHGVKHVLVKIVHPHRPDAKP